MAIRGHPNRHVFHKTKGTCVPKTQLSLHIALTGFHAQPGIGQEHAACAKLLSLNLRGNHLLQSCEGLQHCARLWTVDLRGCALATVEPIVYLGALSELMARWG